MPLISKVRMRYQRRIGFPGYSHLELEIEEEIIIEEGDTAEDIEKFAFERMGIGVKAEAQPIVDLYRGALPEPKTETTSSPETTLRAEAEASKKEAERKDAKRVATGQPTLDSVLDSEPVDLPEEREPGRDLPVYSEEGKRIRGAGQKGFKMGEINVAWVALFEAKIVETQPDVSANVNTERQDIRKWLKMTPLDPGFSSHELNIAVASYGKWRGQGLTTVEAMVEVGNDYIGVYGSNTGGSDSTGEGAESDQAEDEPGDQGPGEGDNDEDSITRSHTEPDATGIVADPEPKA